LYCTHLHTNNTQKNTIDTNNTQKNTIDTNNTQNNTINYLGRFLVNKTNRHTEFQLYWYYDSTCFGSVSAHHQEFLAVHRLWYIYADLMTVCYQEQDGTWHACHAVAYRGGFGVFNPPRARNSEDIGGVLEHMSKKNRRLDFLLQFTVFSYGCNLLNKGFF